MSFIFNPFTGKLEPTTSLAKSGSSPLTGDVTLTGGSGITLTQSGQDISIAAPTLGNAFVQNGNSFGAQATLGTNDNYELLIETNNTGSLRFGTDQHIALGNYNSQTVDDYSLGGGGTVSNVVTQQNTFTTFPGINQGIYTAIELNPSGAVTTSSRGVTNISIIKSGSTQNFTDGNALIGIDNLTFNDSSSGTVTGMQGIYTQTRNRGAGTVTALYGLQLGTANTSTGTVTTQYGAEIGITNSNASGTIGTAYGLRFVLSNSGTITTLNAISIPNAPSGTITTKNAVVIGTGWDAGLVAAGNTVVDGSGNVPAARITGTIFNTAGDSGTSTLIQGDTLTINGTSAQGISTALSGDTFTITAANAVANGSTKGVATFNSTNFSDSSGVINTIQGISSAASPTFVTETLSGLSVSSAVYTDGSKVLTSTAPSSGTIGYWSRSSPTLSPATANDVVSIANTTTTGADLALTNTGVYTGTGIFNLTANSATSGTLALVKGDGLTTGNLLSLTSASTAAGSNTQTGLSIAMSGANGTSTQTTFGARVSNTHTGTSSTNVAGSFTATGGTTNIGVQVAAMTGATSTGVSIGALSGATANKGVVVGAISGTGTGAGITLSPISSTGLSSYGIYLDTLTGGSFTNVQILSGQLTATGSSSNAQLGIGGITGTSNGSTNFGLSLGNISVAGTTTTNYGIQLGTLTGGTTANYQIQTGDITAIASAINAGLTIGTTKAVTGTAASSTNYGININAMDSTGTSNTGIKIGSVTGATSNYALLTGVGGKIGFGTSNPGAVGGTNLSFTRVEIADADGNNSDLSMRVASAGFPSINMATSQGTLASPTLVANGEKAGSLSFLGYDGTNYIYLAAIDGYVNGTPGTNDMPGSLVFSTTADGASTLTERLKIDATGNLVLNNSTNRAIRFLGSGTTDAITGEIVFLESDINYGSKIRHDSSIDSLKFIGHYAGVDTTIMSLDTINSRVGIGTTTPSALLSVGSSSNFTVDGTGLVVAASTISTGTASGITGKLIFKNISNANTLTLQAGATGGTNPTFTLPTADGANGTVLQTNGSGVLSFTSASGGVSSLDALTGGLTLANSTGSGTTVTINNAAADGSTKGIATFNSTNFSAASGVVNTIQGISSAASPTFTGLTVSGLTQGSVVFAGGSGLISQDNSNLFWDNTNKFLGINVGTPLYALDVQGTASNTGIRSTSTTALGSASGGGVFTLTPNVPSAANQRLGIFTGAAYTTGTTVYSAASVSLWSNQAWTSTAGGAYIQFETTPNGAVTRTAICQVTSAGNFQPVTNKTGGLGITTVRWAASFLVSNTTGTSRLTQAKTICTDCGNNMTRGTGTSYILGHDGDFIQVWCEECGVTKMEKISHLTTQKRSLKRVAPSIVFKGFRIIQLSGNSRMVLVDFQYGEGTKAAFNSTVFGDVEMEEFKSLKKDAQQQYLLELGQREWDALEEMRLLEEEIAEEQSEFDNIGDIFMEKDLLKIASSDTISEGIPIQEGGVI